MVTAIVEAASETTPSTPKPLKVGDLKAGAFARVKEDFKNPADAIEILNYLDFLAQNNSVNADDLDLPYEAGGKHEWKMDRAEATRLFFGHLESKAEEIKKSVILPDAKAKEAMQKALQARAVNAANTIRNQVTQSRARADSSLRDCYSYLATARLKEEEVEAMTGGDPAARIDAAIAAIPSTNWNFHRFANNVIEFTSRADIVLRHIDSKAGLHFELNCGKFRLCIDLSSMQPKLLRHERCVPEHLDRRIHPHVNSNGEICFGNGANTANDAIIKGDIVSMLRLLDAMLPNYGDQPFIRIDQFKKNLDERDRLEREKYGKKKAEGTSDVADELRDQEILDDEPEFDDDLEWEGESSE